MPKYAAIYERSADGRSWGACTADLPAFAAGLTRDEAEANLREAVAAYLADLRESGRALPEPRSEAATLTV